MKDKLKQLKAEISVSLFFMFVLLIIILIGCKVEQAQTIEGDAKVHIMHEFPLAEKCFSDPRIATWEDLKTCLELTTNMKYTVDSDGVISEISSDEIDPPISVPAKID
jgi:hypothetical protein